MPDPSAFGRVEMLTRMAGDAQPHRRKGGIVTSSKYRGFSVELRIPKWIDPPKIWVGKLDTLERAQYVADALYHYLGLPPFHFKRGVMTLPAITCIGTVIGTTEELSTEEMCATYVRKIAKGKDFGPQRKDFVMKVKEVFTKSDFPTLAPSQNALAADDDTDEVELELDENAAKALQMSSHSGSSGVMVVQTHVAGTDLAGGSQAVQAYVPSFGIDSNGSDTILRSAGQFINAIFVNEDDCPTSSEGEKIWTESIEELDRTFTAGGFPTPAASNDGEVCQNGYETSPILNIPPGMLRPLTSTSSKLFVTPVELAVAVGTALSSSSDGPSSQFAVNVKRQRIGD